MSPDQSINLVQIAEALDLTKRAVELRAAREQWPFAARTERGGARRYYPLATLPSDVQIAVYRKQQPMVRSSAQPATAWCEARIADAWRRFEASAEKHREEARRRLSALHAVDRLHATGMQLEQARLHVAKQIQRENQPGSVRSLKRWSADVHGAPCDVWLSLLLPAYAGGTAVADCDPQVWDWYKGHYLTRAKPSHSSTYARAAEMAREQGWVIPSADTLLRKMDREVARVTQILLREGPEAAARLIPPQQRDASGFAAGEAVNGDGIKFDRLWVRFEDGEIINTATAWVWQDLRTRRILAHRLAKTENTDLFRLATYDLTGVCAPRDVWVDNTRVAANKLMTAGAVGRHRFKADPEDGTGLLLMLGITPHFTNPDKEVGNPGAKPIERAFGIGGIHSEVATHPRLINRGYSQATAIDVAELREVLAVEIARFNAREGRRTQECRGVLSFDQAWEAAQTQRPSRVLSESQRRLLMMSREVVRADGRSGFIALEAGRGPLGKHRYWCEHLPQFASQKLAVHFDPDNLSADVHVYSLDGRYLFAAQHQATVAFNDTQAAREHAKFKQRRIKAQKQVAAAEVRMDELERKHLYQAATNAPLEPAKPKRKRGSKVVEGSFQRVANPQRDAARTALTGTDDVREANFNDFMERLQRKQLADRL